MTVHQLWDQILASPHATLDDYEQIAALAEKIDPAELGWEDAIRLSPALEKRRDAVRGGLWQPGAAGRATEISARLTDVVNRLYGRCFPGPEQARTAKATEAAAAIRLELAAAAAQAEEPAQGSAGLGARLARVRTKAGPSPEALAESVGLTGTTVRNVEAGKVVPRVDTVERLAAALGVRSAWLAFGDEPQK